MRERYTVWKVFARAWVLLVMLPLQVVACREDGDFHYYYVRDFRFFEPVRRVTQITQEKMFARRRGTYVADLGEDAEDGAYGWERMSGGCSLMFRPIKSLASSLNVQMENMSLAPSSLKDD